MNDTCSPGIRSFVIALVAPVLLWAAFASLSGCDAVRAGEETTVDSVTIANRSSEPIQFYLIEEQFAYKVYWTRPPSDTLPVLLPGESGKQAFSDIPGFEKGDNLYLSVGTLEETGSGEMELTGEVVNFVRSHEELRDRLFRVEITDEILQME